MRRLVILAVDDESGVRLMLKMLLERDYEVVVANNAVEALDVVRNRTIDIAILDVGLPDMSGIELLGKIKEIDPSVGTIMLSGRNSAELAVSALKSGAYDYITKPFDGEIFLATLKRYAATFRLAKEVDYLRGERQKDLQSIDDILSKSPRMKAIFDLIDRVGATSSNVLITGESGTGKEFVAKAIQARGERKERPFVVVNCGAIPSELMESELFGYEKGAFTGAYARKTGKFEHADNGTIFFDEVSTLPLPLQVKLLRVIQEKIFERVGGNVPVKVDVRIIAATNVDLSNAIKKGLFRDDLFYRLNVVPIEIPPLRERMEDIPLLAWHFLKKHSIKCGKSINGITAEALNALRDYAWPGNVRELENLMERLVVVAKDGTDITLDDLPVGMFYSNANTEASAPSKDFQEASRVFERHYIIGVLNKTNWNKGEAAKILNIHRNTLHMKIKALGIKGPHKDA